MIKKQLIPLLLIGLLSGCSNFSDYRTVYRIETTGGERYYSESQPDLDKSTGVYEIEDLDGNRYQLKQDLIYKIEKYKHRK